MAKSRDCVSEGQPSMKFSFVSLEYCSRLVSTSTITSAAQSVQGKGREGRRPEHLALVAVLRQRPGMARGHTSGLGTQSHSAQESCLSLCKRSKQACHSHPDILAVPFLIILPTG